MTPRPQENAWPIQAFFWLEWCCCGPQFSSVLLGELVAFLIFRILDTPQPDNPQSRHPERSASQIYCLTEGLWRAVEGTPRMLVWPMLLTAFRPPKLCKESKSRNLRPERSAVERPAVSSFFFTWALDPQPDLRTYSHPLDGLGSSEYWAVHDINFFSENPVGPYLTNPDKKGDGWLAIAFLSGRLRDDLLFSSGKPIPRRFLVTVATNPCINSAEIGQSVTESESRPCRGVEGLYAGAG
jgi:hypothetical protein